jgi:hypothetical protein
LPWASSPDMYGPYRLNTQYQIPPTRGRAGVVLRSRRLEAVLRQLTAMWWSGPVRSDPTPPIPAPPGRTPTHPSPKSPPPPSSLQKRALTPGTCCMACCPLALTGSSLSRIGRRDERWDSLDAPRQNRTKWDAWNPENTVGGIRTRDHRHKRAHRSTDQDRTRNSTTRPRAPAALAALGRLSAIYVRQ